MDHFDSGTYSERQPSENLMNKHVLKVRGTTGTQRVGASCCCFSPNGKKIAGGAADGSIHIWLERKIYRRPDFILRVAPNSSASSSVSSSTRIAIGSDNASLVARYESGHIILWNISSASTAKTPLKIISGMRNDYFSANVCFSPDMESGLLRYISRAGDHDFTA